MQINTAKVEQQSSNNTEAKSAGTAKKKSKKNKLKNLLGIKVDEKSIMPVYFGTE